MKPPSIRRTRYLIDTEKDSNLNRFIQEHPTGFINTHEGVMCYDKKGRQTIRRNLLEVTCELFETVETKFPTDYLGVKFFRSLVDEPIKPKLWRTPEAKRPKVDLKTKLMSGTQLLEKQQSITHAEAVH